MPQRAQAILEAFYARLFRAFGPQHWWPAQTRFEVIVGAILTQNTNWGNVEKALGNLKRANLLSPRGLKKISVQKLAALIRPAGYFNIKAQRLKNFLSFLFGEYGGQLAAMGREHTRSLREKLLHVNGIGPETADSILLYTFDRPIFVVDAYTKRLLYRHGMLDQASDYQKAQDLFTKALPRDAALFNEFHALIVRLGKEFCRPRPNCHQCPLRDIHYSLTMKCAVCHKVLFQKKKRIGSKGRYLCRACSLK